MVCIVCVLTSTLWLLDIVTLCDVRHLMSLIVFIHFNSPSSWWCVCSYADSGVWLIHLIHYMQVGAGYCNAQLKMFRALTKKKVNLCSYRLSDLHNNPVMFITPCFHSPSVSWRNLCWLQLPINSYLLFSSACKTSRQ